MSLEFWFQIKKYKVIIFIYDTCSLEIFLCEFDNIKFDRNYLTLSECITLLYFINQQISSFILLYLRPFLRNRFAANNSTLQENVLKGFDLGFDLASDDLFKKYVLQVLNFQNYSIRRYSNGCSLKTESIGFVCSKQRLGIKFSSRCFPLTLGTRKKLKINRSIMDLYLKNKLTKEERSRDHC